MRELEDALGPIPPHYRKAIEVVGGREMSDVDGRVWSFVDAPDVVGVTYLRDMYPRSFVLASSDGDRAWVDSRNDVRVHRLDEGRSVSTGKSVEAWVEEMWSVEASGRVVCESHAASLLGDWEPSVSPDLSKKSLSFQFWYRFMEVGKCVVFRPASNRLLSGSWELSDAGVLKISVGGRSQLFEVIESGDAVLGLRGPSPVRHAVQYRKVDATHVFDRPS